MAAPRKIDPQVLAELEGRHTDAEIARILRVSQAAVCKAKARLNRRVGLTVRADAKAARKVILGMDEAGRQLQAYLVMSDEILHELRGDRLREVLTRCARLVLGREELTEREERSLDRVVREVGLLYLAQIKALEGKLKFVEVYVRSVASLLELERGNRIIEIILELVDEYGIGRDEFRRRFDERSGLGLALAG